jgi:small nuclear ribonucleoprotein (snRNP)-like protein
MEISKLIKVLEDIKRDNGDIQVVVSEGHEYWGSVESYVEEYNIRVSENAMPQGPKSGKSEKAVIISYS